MKCLTCGKEGDTKWTRSKHAKYCSLECSSKRIVSDITKQKLSKAGKKQRGWSDERKARHSKAMKEAVGNHPESYTSSNRGRTKQLCFDDIKFQGQWELDFYKWCKGKNIAIRRNDQWFPYTWNGERKYNPDFYLPDYDLYVEVKGYKTDRDRAKWASFPNKLLVVGKENIADIRDGRYKIP